MAAQPARSATRSLRPGLRRGPSGRAPCRATLLYEGVLVGRGAERLHPGFRVCDRVRRDGEGRSSQGVCFQEGARGHTDRGEPAMRTGSAAVGGSMPARGSSVRGVCRVRMEPTSGAAASRCPSAPRPKRARRVAMIDVWSKGGRPSPGAYGHRDAGAEARARPVRCIPTAGSRCTRPFHARGSAAHPGSAGWHAPPPRRPASRTPVRSPRHGSSGPPPPSPGP
jgi:hypothetical protein